MTIFNVISLFGGLALFLYGMRLMGDGLKQSSSGALKQAMEKVTNNPVIGFLLGMAVTAVIQSSTATIVITSGLVGAGIITLHQSLGIILGANVGTTITGQIIRLLDVSSEGAAWLEFFKPSTLAPLAAVLGILMIMLFRFKGSEMIGGIAMGFGILFTGLLNMTAAVAPLSKSEAFSELFVQLADKPVLGFLAGAGVAFSIQSSSATIGILQALSITGKLTFSSIYSVIIGIYIGDCVTTAIVCSIGAKADAKRTGMVHILFNLCEVVLVTLGVTILHRMGMLDSIWSVPITSGGIANTHTVFNLVCALIILPFSGLLEKLSRRIIADDKSGDNISHELRLETLDKAFFRSPQLAFQSAHDLIGEMCTLAQKNVNMAMDCLIQFDRKLADEVREAESNIDLLADKISDYLVQLSPHLGTGGGVTLLDYYIKCISEFERIGDYALNLAESAEELKTKGAGLSEGARNELMVVKDVLNEILSYADKAFDGTNEAFARKIEPIEEVVDDMVFTLRENHVLRLRDGKCNVDAGIEFLNALVNIERVADQCSNIGVLTITLCNPELAESKHEYITQLHQGGDSAFNKEYTDAHDRYFNRLNSIVYKD